MPRYLFYRLMRSKWAKRYSVTDFSNKISREEVGRNYNLSGISNKTVVVSLLKSCLMVKVFHRSGQGDVQSRSTWDAVG